ncbi:MAG: DMT family transporter [bacterium]|nr:DMT family transporter [bacterium]
MNPFLLQIIAALLFAVTMVLDKRNLRRYKLAPPDYTFMVFIWLVVFSGIVTTFTHHVDLVKLAEARYYYGFVVLVLLAFLWNKLYYYFELHERMEDFEVINLTVPAATAVMAGIVFPEERNIIAYLAVGVSLVTLAVVRLQKKNWQFNTYAWLILVMILAMAAETVMRKYMLAVFDPATLYFYRVTGVTILLYLFNRPKNLPTKWQPWLATGLASALGTAAMIMMFYGYAAIGVILTTMIFLLNPLAVYWLDSLILHERLKLKNMVASVVILAAITITAVLS